MTDLETRAAAPRNALRRAAPALFGYAAVRALGLLTLALWSAARDKSAYTLLTARWDALWYTRVAELGYGYEVRLPNGDVHSNLAFFPLLPWLERGIAAVTPLSYADAGFVVSLLASLAAAWGIFAVADHVYGRRAGVCAVLVWAVLPVGIVQSMAYSESLFTALAAWSLYAVLTGRWLTAGALAALAGLTRPVGLAVVAAVWVTGIAAFLRDRATARTPSFVRDRAASRAPSFVRDRSAAAAQSAPETPRAPSPTGDGPAGGAPAWRRALGMLLAPLGAAGYVLWVGHRTGKGPLGYLDVQAGWRNGFDGGYAFARFVADKFTSFPSALAGVGLIVGVGLVVWLYVVCVRQGQPLPLLVYAGVVTALALCASSYFGSKPRLLLPAFPLLLPLALALARSRTSRAALVVAGVALASAVYGAFWLNGSGPP
ncbi:dolichyl-phosphate-mannose-protein mannosyltransferase [Streptomyces sp. TLI_55]|uniref:mannosyltransferase family protein n=1 Tax=Streptomyces sp. TLI_55 TaxID=1938861 RepID=UPI000BCE1A3C|nr:mannosyltransferase family protein [Streptomyces sp. TLI_55]SNX57365.1 dolichyl-phosphate-mannose-protein mannosyltransferase [Streptomyces sp. TLI_55]